MSVVLCIFSPIYAVGNMLQCLVLLFIQECICAYGAECIHALPAGVGGGDR